MSRRSHRSRGRLRPQVPQPPAPSQSTPRPIRRAGLWLLGAVAVAGLATAALAGRGDDLPQLPPGAVALVGETVITKRVFDRHAREARRSGGMGTGGLRGVTYDPPDYSACVAAKKDVPAPTGGERQSDDRLKDECKAEFEDLMPGVMEPLIEAEWIRREAKAQGVELSKTLKKGALEVQQTILSESGAKKDDLRASKERLSPSMQVSLLEQELADEVAGRASKVSEQDIREYYGSNSQRLEEQERRDLRLVLTETKTLAARALGALQRGESWSEVAKRYSTDETTAGGGKLTGVGKGQLEEELDQAVFTATRGEIDGPLKTQFGWYVFEITKIAEKRQQPLDEAKQRIERILRDRRAQEAVSGLNERISERYMPKTVCAEEFKVALCANGP